MFLKTIRQSRFEENVKVKLPSVVVRTSFEIFRALFNVRPRMRRLSQALQVECKKGRIGVLTCINSSNNCFERNGFKQSQVSKESAR